MRRKLLIAAVAALAVTCVSAPGVALGGTLDQQQPNGGGATLQIQSMQSVAQTFTAGLTGGLDQVDLKLSGGGTDPVLPLTVEIRNTDGGFPGATVLASASVPAPAPASPTFVPIAFATPPPVAAGTQYAIVAYGADVVPKFWTWAVDATDPYATGSSFFQHSSPPGPTWTEFTGSDLTFKTYVLQKPTATPTGKRAAALKKCKKKRSKAKRRKCRKKARKLPV
jgi:hypothetical protein